MYNVILSTNCPQALNVPNSCSSLPRCWHLDIRATEATDLFQLLVLTIMYKELTWIPLVP